MGCCAEAFVDGFEVVDYDASGVGNDGSVKAPFVAPPAHGVLMYPEGFGEYLVASYGGSWHGGLFYSFYSTLSPPVDCPAGMGEGFVNCLAPFGCTVLADGDYKCVAEGVLEYCCHD